MRTIAQLCRAVSSPLRHVSTVGKKLVKQRYLLHNASRYVKIRPLTAEISWKVWGTPANFNGFRVFALLLQRRRSTEVNQTLRDVWPSPGLHFPGLLLRKFTLRPSLAFCYIGSVTAQHSSSGCQPNFAAWYLHATRRASRSTLGGRTV